MISNVVGEAVDKAVFAKNSNKYVIVTLNSNKYEELFKSIKKHAESIHGMLNKKI